MDESKVQTDSAALVEVAQNLVVETPAQLQEAARLRIGCVDLQRQIKEHHAGMKQAAWQAHKKVVEAEKRLLAPLVAAQTFFDRKMGEYQRQEREHLERQRLLREAELAASARSAKEAELKAAAEAKTEEEKQAHEEIAELIVPAPVLIDPPAALAGLAPRPKWSAIVYDKAAFLAWACEQGRTALLAPDLVALNALARQLRQASDIPGVEFRDETVYTQKRITT